MSKFTSLIVWLIFISLTAYGAGEPPQIDDIHDHDREVAGSFVFPPPPEPIKPPDTKRRAAISKSQPQIAAGTVTRSSITSPVAGSNIQATTTFQWSDEGANAYLFRISAVECYASDIVNQFGIAGTSFTANGLDTSQKLYASIWAQPVAGGSYFTRDCAVYNVDADGDGIYNEVDPNPNSFDETQTYSVGGEQLSILPTGRVAVLQISQARYNELSSGDTNNLEQITNTLYTFLEDAFDFIFITNDLDNAAASYAGRYHPVQNSILGIGGFTFNNTSRWGSDNSAGGASNDGRLQGVIHFPELNSFSGGPGLHELMHRWANRLDSIPDGNTGSHWGFSSGGGQLGGWAPGTLQNLGGGQYQANNGRPGSNSFGLVANGGNGLPYSNIELYVMGMIPPAQLQGMDYAMNGAWVNSGTGTFSASGIVNVTPAQIIATDGARVPSSASAQKNFNVLNVIVTTSTAETSVIGELDEEAYRFGLASNEGTSSYNFWEATGGRGTLNMATAVSALKPELVGTGNPDPPVSDDEGICFPIKTGAQSAAMICL